MTEKYFLFIVEDPRHFDDWTPADWAPLNARHAAFAEAVKAAGAEVLFSDPLDEATIRVTPGEDGPLYSDGPFGETREIVLGYYKLAVRDEAQALELAALCPTAGWVDVRRVLDPSEYSEG